MSDVLKLKDVMVLDALCFLHSLSKENKKYESQDEAFEVVYEYIKELETKVSEWIPFECREADQEEKEVYGCKEVLCCKMPDEDEEIYVSYANGYVGIDILLSDETGYYLDSGSDFMTEAVAWMHLPAPYRKKVE